MDKLSNKIKMGLPSRIALRRLSRHDVSWGKKARAVAEDILRREGSAPRIKLPLLLKSFQYMDSAGNYKFVDPEILPNSSIMASCYDPKGHVLKLKGIRDLAVESAHENHKRIIDQEDKAIIKECVRLKKRLDKCEADLDNISRKYTGLERRRGGIEEPDLNRAEFLKRQKNQVIYPGGKIVILDNPWEYRDCRNQIIRWYQDLILSIYRDTREYKGKSNKEIIDFLGIEEEGMEARVLRSRYTALSVGNEEKGEINGLFAADLVEAKGIAEMGAYIYLAESMVRVEARKKKMQVRMGQEIFQIVFRCLRESKNWFRHQWDLLVRGIPVMARYQSKRPARAMTRFKSFWLPGEGDPPGELRKILAFQAKKQGVELGKDYIMRGVYRGPVAIKEEEREISFLQKVGWFHHLICRLFNYKTAKFKRYEKWDELFDNRLGPQDAVYGIGYITIGRLFMRFILETGLLLRMKKFFSRALFSIYA